MAKVTSNDVQVGSNGRDIVLVVPIDGRDRRVILDPVSALAFGNAIANAGADLLTVDPGLPLVENVHLRPFDASGRAMLRFTLSDLGAPLTVLIDQPGLAALQAAADAALEFSERAGSA